MHFSENVSSINHSWFHILSIGVPIIAINSNKTVLLKLLELQFGKNIQMEEERNSEMEF